MRKLSLIIAKEGTMRTASIVVLVAGLTIFNLMRDLVSIFGIALIVFGLGGMLWPRHKGKTTKRRFVFFLMVVAGVLVATVETATSWTLPVGILIAFVGTVSWILEA